MHASGAQPPAGSRVGDLYRLPDLLTGFSEDAEKEARWCMVVEDRGISVRVAPRSKTSEDGIFVPKDAEPRVFSEPGRFYDAWTSILVVDLKAYELRGKLEQRYRDRVVDQYREGEEAKRRKRRERRKRS